MKKLNKDQKELIVKKLEETGQFSNLVEKAKKDLEGGVSEKDWDKARKTVVKNIMRDSNSRFFQVANLIHEGEERSKTVVWLFDNRESVGFVAILAGCALIFLDPGTFAPRGQAPALQGPMDYLRMIQYFTNWGYMGWAGVVAFLAGYMWSRHPKLFLD